MKPTSLAIRHLIGTRILPGGLPLHCAVTAWQLLRHTARTVLIGVRRLTRRQRAPVPFQPLSTMTLRDIGVRRSDTSNLLDHKRRGVIRPRSLWS